MHQTIKKSLIALGISMAASTVSLADTWDVKITNLTHGNHFTPLLVTAHDHDTHLFEVGMAASPALQIMAECGAIADLAAAAVTADTVANPVGANPNNADDPGFLAPGATSPSAMLTDPAGSHLSVVAMILPTNDAFIGLESQHIPAFDTATGASNTHVFFVNGYDAGTEANNELLPGTACAAGVAGMPGAPGGDAGTGGANAVAADANTTVHIHRGVLGDDSATAGTSDLDNTIHRWQNPVARVVVTVTQ